MLFINSPTLHQEARLFQQSGIFDKMNNFASHSVCLLELQPHIIYFKGTNLPTPEQKLKFISQKLPHIWSVTTSTRFYIENWIMMLLNKFEAVCIAFKMSRLLKFNGSIKKNRVRSEATLSCIKPGSLHGLSTMWIWDFVGDWALVLSPSPGKLVVTIQFWIENELHRGNRPMVWGVKK